MNQTTRFRMLFLSLRPHGSRRRVEANKRVFRRISIHSPRVGRDNCKMALKTLLLRFQSTRPVRGETSTHVLVRVAVAISIHSPRSGRDIEQSKGLLGQGLISIHSPLMGQDVAAKPVPSSPAVFQPTRPAWGETQHQEVAAAPQRISIHSPRVGRDFFTLCTPRSRRRGSPIRPR